ncbi:hypothetical protein PI124_g11716 [Phytophthora idaei]|nr:hypothetical protein PI125_g13088 [Phytophthora idaei]KAG3152421.1 hypothetical protein PI126_g10525 [Phytophthora idaei]KAG3243450.1 hypothetical protein PI124_g11716 [Phytophthora idaei]
MESGAVSDGLNADEMAQWDSTVQNSVLPKYDKPLSSTPSSNESDRQMWETS